MEPEFESVYVAVDEEVVSLHATWSVYRSLFGSEHSIELFNRWAPYAGGTIQNAILDSVLLLFTRLCDPAESQRGRFQNLSFERLISQLPDAPEELVSDLKTALDRKQACCSRLCGDDSVVACRA
jgi:hypothetical protein